MAVLYYVDKNNGNNKVIQITSDNNNNNIIEEISNHNASTVAHDNGISGSSTDVYLEEYGKTAKELGQIGGYSRIDGSTVNSNSIIDPGNYIISNSKFELNYPDETNFIILHVIRDSSNSNRIIQHFSYLDYVREYVRYSGDLGQSWSEWNISKLKSYSSVNIFISKNGSDSNTGISEDAPLLTSAAAINKAISIQTDGEIRFCFGPGDWSDVSINGFTLNCSRVVVTNFDGNLLSTDPGNMPSFNKLRFYDCQTVIGNIEASEIGFYKCHVTGSSFCKISSLLSFNSLIAISHDIHIKNTVGQTQGIFHITRGTQLQINTSVTFTLDADLEQVEFLYCYDSVHVFLSGSGNPTFVDNGSFSGRKLRAAGGVDFRSITPSDFPGTDITGNYSINSIPQQGVVLTSGNQEIRGIKTFKSSIHCSSENQAQNPILISFPFDRDYIPEVVYQRNIFFTDSNMSPSSTKVFGKIGHALYTDGGSGLYLVAYPNNSSLEDTVSSSLYIYVGNDGSVQYARLPELRPDIDNSRSLGTSSYRWSQLYAGTATINTSDEREKTSILNIPDEVLDAWGEVNFYQYQFLDAVESKGSDKARLHTGIIAQRILEIFKNHNLDATKYGLLCYDSWEAEDWDETIIDKEAVYDEDGNIIEPEESHVVHHHRDAGDRYGVRYEEALALEAAYQRRRADRLEERVTIIERRLG